jgi:glycosyltransferase involved in cell wall biosynthesis
VLILRKVFIVNSLSNGGAERVVSSLANSFSKNGHEIHVILLHDFIDYKIESKINIHFLEKSYKKLNKLWSYKKIRSLLVKRIRGIEQEYGYIDLITVHLPFPHFVFKSKEYNSRTYYTVHTVYSKKFPRFTVFFRGFLKKIYDGKKIIAVSNGVAEELTDYWKINPQFISVIHNPLDIREIRSKAEKDLISIDKYILAVGRLVKLKQFDFLLDAFKESGKYQEYKLIILGEGPEKERLSKKADDLGISNQVVLTGWQSNPYAWMKNADLFVLSSEYEAFPMVLIEALACNTPVVSVDCNYGPREILVDELRDFLVPVGDMDLLAQKINQALINYPSVTNKYTNRFNIDFILSQYLELIKRQ